MTIIKLNQTDNVSSAMQNFALSQSSGDSFNMSFEMGLDMIETKIEENEYLLSLASWKTGNLKVEVSKMQQNENEEITGWKTILV